MTAVVTDLDTALARADRRWADRRGDEPALPEYLGHLANWLRPLLGTETDTSNAMPAADNEQATALAAVAAELRVDNARLADEVQAALERAERIGAELDQVRAELDRKGRLLRARDEEANKLDADLIEAKNDRDAAHQALDEQAAARVEPHHHLYEIPAPGSEPEPCSCGLPYPRSDAAYEVDEDEVLPDVEPWAEVLGSIRDELEGWPAA